MSKIISNLGVMLYDETPKYLKFFRLICLLPSIDYVLHF